MDNPVRAHHNEDEDEWVWKNGLCVRIKERIQLLAKKLHQFSNTIEAHRHQSSLLKDVIDLNTELTGYFASLADNVNIRDLFDFLTICFYEYEHFFKDHQALILNMEGNITSDLLPLAYDIVYNHIRSILEFINNNTVEVGVINNSSSSSNS